MFYALRSAYVVDSAKWRSKLTPCPLAVFLLSIVQASPTERNIARDTDIEQDRQVDRRTDGPKDGRQKDAVAGEHCGVCDQRGHRRRQQRRMVRKDERPDFRRLPYDDHAGQVRPPTLPSAHINRLRCRAYVSLLVCVRVCHTVER